MLDRRVYGIGCEIKMKGSDSIDLRSYKLWTEELIPQLFEYEFAFDMPPYSGGGDRIEKETIYNVQKRGEHLVPVTTERPGYLTDFSQTK